MLELKTLTRKEYELQSGSKDLPKIADYSNSAQELFNKFSLISVRTLIGHQGAIYEPVPISLYNLSNAFPYLFRAFYKTERTRTDLVFNFELFINKDPEQETQEVVYGMVSKPGEISLDIQFSNSGKINMEFKTRDEHKKRLKRVINQGNNFLKQQGISKNVLVDVINYQYLQLERTKKS